MAKTELFADWLGGDLVISNQGFSTGKKFFVHAGTGTDAGGFGNSPDSPLATWDYAVGLCTASKGDSLSMRPNHCAAALNLAFTAAIGERKLIK